MKDIPNLPLRRETCRVRLRQKMIVDQHPGIWLEHRNQLSQNLDRVRIRPVVEDVAEEIDISLDRLFGEEVMSAELNPSSHIFWNIALFHSFDDVRTVLDDELERRMGVCDSHAHASVGTAQVYNGAGTERVPWEVVDEEGRCNVWTVAECLHCAGESFGLLRMGSEISEEREVGVLC